MQFTLIGIPRVVEHSGQWDSRRSAAGTDEGSRLSAVAIGTPSGGLNLNYKAPDPMMNAEGDSGEEFLCSCVKGSNDSAGD